MQDYKLFSRAVYAGPTIYTSPTSNQIALQNLDEALEYLNAYYLAEGYTVLSVSYVGEYITEPGNPNAARGQQYTWHLVKDVKVQSNKKE